MMLRVELRPLAASIVVVIKQLDPSQVNETRRPRDTRPLRMGVENSQSIFPANGRVIGGNSADSKESPRPVCRSKLLGRFRLGYQYIGGVLSIGYSSYTISINDK